ncbi:MAG: MFS transporter, partial [Lachnospiraceae bacterium]|nr:MFS transporter [Lachnospiraceae bacterium]
MAKVVSEKKPKFGLIMAVYLLGIFMGALDTGIVTPARTIIQESLGVSDTAGIWMITIYTLAYAASIPVMGKLADRVGRRTIYLISIALFGGGSLLCGLSHSFNSFTALLISRAIQAIGGGGIVPIANAEFGTTFPEEKRGMALGLVGGVYGIANIFGASAGSAVMDLFGTDRWEFIFYVNVPIAVFILIAGLFCLPNTKEKATTKIDGLGTCMLVVMVLCIMYGLKNIDFFDFISTLTSISVYPFLIAFAILTPFFIMVEKRADDPILNLKFFTNSRILVTLMVAVITGFVLMAVIFVPQLCENAMKVPTGSGGYFVIALGVCAGLGAPFSGKLTDKFGPKIVLGFGLLVSLIGSLIVIFFTTVTPNKVNVFASLMLIGLGIGFTMGAPLNYMMLWEVPDKEANSALATLSLVRSLGTVVAPAIMVGFIAHAGMGMQDNLMAVMPKEVNIPKLPYAEELSEKMQEQGVEGMPD